MLLTVIGAIILFFAIPGPFWNLVLAIFFVLWGIIGTIWFIIFICPYCHFFDTRACPCGYGQLAAKVTTLKDGDRFNVKFKKHISIIFPLWFIPVIIGSYALFIDFSNLILFLIILFIINSYIILPLVSRQYGCAHCPQKDTCPWMK
jgi:hypothetical protein